jgi:N-acetylglucosaminyl-diphospho-decaprenol L-rhamnosyltransferase
VQLLVNEQNEGYQRANNRGIEAATGEYLLLINADALLRPGSVETMIARMRSDDRAAVIGPRLVYGDGSFQRWTAGAAPGVAAIAAFYLYAERVSPAAARRSLFLAHDVDLPFRPDWVSSACMLVRRAALEEIGLLDERYFCYMDDVDLCQRLRDAGWHVWYEPSAEVVHLMGQASKRNTGAASPAAIRNFNDYVHRRSGAGAALAARTFEVLGFGTRALAYFARGTVSGNGGRAAARAHARNVLVSLQRGHV